MIAIRVRFGLDSIQFEKVVKMYDSNSIRQLDKKWTCSFFLSVVSSSNRNSGTPLSCIVHNVRSFQWSVKADYRFQLLGVHKTRSNGFLVVFEARLLSSMHHSEVLYVPAIAIIAGYWWHSANLICQALAHRCQSYGDRRSMEGWKWKHLQL